MEAWRAVPEWEGFYEVSDSGKVRSLDRTVKGRHGPTRYRGRVLATRAAGNGYEYVTLSRGSEVTHCAVHSLVCAAFLGSRDAGMEVCHGNGIKTDNRIANLRYDSRSANALEYWDSVGRKSREHYAEYSRQYKRRWREQRRLQGLEVS
jgi:NUMOD4 motif-containing protein/HNH endonuclease